MNRASSSALLTVSTSSFFAGINLQSRWQCVRSSRFHTGHVVARFANRTQGAAVFGVDGSGEFSGEI
jgi:hypothetical protein